MAIIAAAAAVSMASASGIYWYFGGESEEAKLEAEAKRVDAKMAAEKQKLIDSVISELEQFETSKLRKVPPSKHPETKHEVLERVMGNIRAHLNKDIMDVNENENKE